MKATPAEKRPSKKKSSKKVKETKQDNYFVIDLGESSELNEEYISLGPVPLDEALKHIEEYTIEQEEVINLALVKVEKKFQITVSKQVKET